MLEVIYTMLLVTGFSSLVVMYLCKGIQAIIAYDWFKVFQSFLVMTLCYWVVASILFNIISSRGNAP